MRLELAFTGAVGQSGQIMAVGGVSRKIEGFFTKFVQGRLTGSQGRHHPLRQCRSSDALERDSGKRAQGKFAIYPVRRIEEALFCFPEFLLAREKWRLYKGEAFTILLTGALCAWAVTPGFFQEATQ